MIPAQPYTGLDYLLWPPTNSNVIAYPRVNDNPIACRELMLPTGRVVKVVRIMVLSQEEADAMFAAAAGLAGLDELDHVINQFFPTATEQTMFNILVFEEIP